MRKSLSTTWRYALPEEKMCVKILKTLERKEVAPRGGLEPAIFQLTAEESVSSGQMVC
jgi:hypothetical protein